MKRSWQVTKDTVQRFSTDNATMTPFPPKQRPAEGAA
jgi:hypothetical protein